MREGAVKYGSGSWGRGVGPFTETEKIGESRASFGCWAAFSR